MKQALRKRLLEERNSLTNVEIENHSEQICKTLLPMLNGIVGIYKAYGSEVNLSFLEQTPYQFAVPKTIPNKELEFYRLDEHIVWEKGCYGILEPSKGRLCMHMDMMIIPLVGFDEECNRLGHGGGYYDRFLKNFDGLKIGVAHECQKCETVYEEAHDIPLNIIVTEAKIYKRNN